MQSLQELSFSRVKDLETQAVYAKYYDGLSEEVRDMIHRKREYYFKRSPVQEQILLDEEASFSVTEEKLAEETCDEIANVIERYSAKSVDSITITDATACVGGNSIAFAKHFQSVNSIEIDGFRARLLLHNAYVSGHSRNLRVFHGDCMSEQAHKTLKQDVIFFDPPWGGPEYIKEHRDGLPLFPEDHKLQDTIFLDPPWGDLEYIREHRDSMPLFLGDHKLQDVCESFKHSTDFIAIKVPCNFNFSTFRPSGMRLVLRRGMGRRSDRRGMPFKFILLVYACDYGERLEARLRRLEVRLQQLEAHDQPLETRDQRRAAKIARYR